MSRLKRPAHPVHADRVSLDMRTERPSTRTRHRISAHRRFHAASPFSAADLAERLRRHHNPDRHIARLLTIARHRYETGDGVKALVFPRMIHTLASALSQLTESTEQSSGALTMAAMFPRLAAALSAADTAWLESLGLCPSGVNLTDWCERGHQVAFEYLRRAIVDRESNGKAASSPALRSDEIVWGRAPARLDLCGGWTDTPPYTLEFGGRVLNAAVNLNGQPPIQVFARVIDEPLVRITSIDRGTRLEIARLEELLDYRDLGRESSLVKAALVLAGLGDSTLPLPRQLATLFGGGIELTTLAAIPKGSGLGTSSIMGAVLLAVLQRMIGRSCDPKELFHHVLRLEQTLTTGGGWQDQIGGVVDGVKLVTTEPGVIPNPDIQFVPADVLLPASAGGQTLLYYTGMTRLAKNILQRVVGRYLDRDRSAMAALRELRTITPQAAAAMARRDMAAFGGFVDAAWRLNKQLDPDSSNADIEALLARVRPHLFGAKLLGAGGGGFLLLVCRSPQDAQNVERILDADPPNQRARFFQFHVNTEGLRITAC